MKVSIMRVFYLCVESSSRYRQNEKKFVLGNWSVAAMTASKEGDRYLQKKTIVSINFFLFILLVHYFQALNILFFIK
jgi:hypothetical protein